MSSIQNMKINTLYENKLVNNDFIHKYSIYLEKNHFYYIELINNDNYEFNLRLLDSKNDEINLNNVKTTKDMKISYDYESNEDEQLNNIILDHNEFIDKNYKEDSSDSSELELPDVNDKVTSTDMKIVLYDETTKENIEIIIGLSEDKKDNSEMEKNAINYMNAIQNFKRINDYKNKIYFKPSKNDNYILSVNSEYENEEGEYSLIIREVEDVSSGNNLILNEYKKLKFKKKNIIEKFSVLLDKKTKYTLSCKNDGIKIFIFGEGQTLTNKDDLYITFKTNVGGLYLIEIMSCNDNHENRIELKETQEKNREDLYRDESKYNLLEDSKYEENNKLESEYKIREDMTISKLVDNSNMCGKKGNYLDNIILKDIKNEDKYEVYIENGELKVKKLTINY